VLVCPNGGTEPGRGRGTGWWTVRLGRTVAVLAAVGSLAGCLGTSTGGTPGSGGTDTSSSGGNGYGGKGGDANGTNGVGGNGGNGYGGWGANGYGGKGGNSTDGRDGADGVDGVGGAGGGSFSDPAGMAGSGRLTTRTIDLSGVTSVVAEANFVVHLRMGNPVQAAVTTDDNLTDRVEATVTGNQLRLGIKPGMSVRNATLSADVTVGQLDRLATAGASRVTLAPELTSPALQLSIAGASTITGPVAVGRVLATVSGAGSLALSGTVQDLRFSAAGASRLPLSDLTVRYLDATLSGASHATVTVTGTLAVQAAGASVLDYRGNPSVTRSQTSGMSSIVRDSP
jgi:Putative auto-transporter adhesin, head GIN domain